jgi:transposase
MPGCGTLTAAKAIGETAGAQRFPTATKFARITGTAPIPASSGNTTRHRLDRGGNRQLNAALHRIAITQIPIHPTPQPKPTSPASSPKVRPAQKQSAASNANSYPPSGTSYNPAPHPPAHHNPKAANPNSTHP